METDGLKERVGLITGAGRGLGKGMAMALARAGVRLALVARDQEALADAVSEARALREGDAVVLSESRGK
ncbi:MAG: SDR family NAD(P)-dependent oxidoreductase [Acidobacteriia bacterium]|nr:SDR family NAD(P)-dependent oxidoreductase [Terriglobia bacterium]